MSDTYLNEDMLQTIANDPESHLTEKELLEVETYYQAIDLSDSATMIEYGSDVQKKLSELSTRMLSQLHSHDMDDIAHALDTTVSYLKAIEDENNKFSLSKKKKELSIRETYQKAQQNVDSISEILQKHQIQLMKNCTLLDQLNHMNTVFFRDLTVRIVAANRKITDCKLIQLPQLQTKAAASGLEQDSQAVTTLLSQLNQLEKRIEALKLTQTVSLQSAPLIRLVVSNQVSMAEKIQNTLLNTIPLWKNQVIISLSMEHALQTESAQQKMHSVISKGLFKHTKNFKSFNSNTMLDTTRLLMDTLSEVSHIQKMDAI